MNNNFKNSCNNYLRIRKSLLYSFYFFIFNENAAMIVTNFRRVKP